jgi:uncharacterized protein YbjT (DUF2867 family)
MITIIGGSGNIGKGIATLLLRQGCKLRLIARRAEGLQELVDAGATAAVGDVNDSGFLVDAFCGSSAVFAMIPPDYAAADMIARQDAAGEAIATAIRRAGVKKVVHLSSVGADLMRGTGPIIVLHRQERRLNVIPGIDVVHLRCGWFMENLLRMAEPVAQDGTLRYIIAPDAPMYMVATRDVALTAATLLAEPHFTGCTVRYLLGQRTLTFREVAPILGDVVGRPETTYQQVPAAQGRSAMMARGFSASFLDLREELSNSFSAGILQATVARDADNTTSTSIEDFARTVFAPAVLCKV